VGALIEADARGRWPLPATIDPPGATDEEVRRNFAALRHARVSQELLAVLTARFHRRFENAAINPREGHVAPRPSQSPE
jgi:hypothetical protein